MEWDLQPAQQPDKQVALTKYMETTLVRQEQRVVAESVVVVKVVVKKISRQEWIGDCRLHILGFVRCRISNILYNAQMQPSSDQYIDIKTMLVDEPELSDRPGVPAELMTPTNQDS